MATEVDWPLGDVGLLEVVRDPVHPDLKPLGDWVEKEYPGQTIPLPDPPRPLPLVPLLVRMIVGEGSRHDEDDAMEIFEAARAHWRKWASIDLRLERGRVETVEDPEGHIYEASTTRDALDWTHRPGQSSISVVLSDRSPVHSMGLAFFRRPKEWSDSAGVPRLGHGIVMREASASLLAHELGHTLGLTHMPIGANSEHDVRALGMPTTSYCLRPFADDLLDLHEALQRANLMNGRAAGNPPTDLAARWLSWAQIQRARLTITTRHCPYALFNDESQANEAAGQVLLNDLTGEFAAETVPADRILKNPLFKY